MNPDYSVEQIENIVIDAGVVYINYGLPDERILAPTQGGNSFEVNQEIRDIDFDGKRGKTKGLRRVISEDATLTVNLMDMSQENIKIALVGVGYDETTKAITSGSVDNATLNYIKNVALLGETLGGEFKIITIYNALGDGGLKLAMKDKNEASIELKLSAHYDPADKTQPIYKIEQVETLT